MLIRETNCVFLIRLTHRLLEQVTESTEHGVENEDQEAKRPTQGKKKREGVVYEYSNNHGACRYLRNYRWHQGSAKAAPKPHEGSTKA